MIRLPYRFLNYQSAATSLFYIGTDVLPAGLVGVITTIDLTVTQDVESDVVAVQFNTSAGALFLGETQTTGATGQLQFPWRGELAVCPADGGGALQITGRSTTFEPYWGVVASGYVISAPAYDFLE